jgi:hypothetical protein
MSRTIARTILEFAALALGAYLICPTLTPLQYLGLLIVLLVCLSVIGNFMKNVILYKEFLTHCKDIEQAQHISKIAEEVFQSVMKGQSPNPLTKSSHDKPVH